MNRYADSSFLVSCYLSDSNTAQAKAWLAQAGTSLPFTVLHGLEVRNAFKLGVSRGLFPAADAAAAWANLERDLRDGRLRKMALNWQTAFRIAARLSERFSATTGTRSLDILHVATAKVLHAVDLVSFDTRQRTLAAKVGLHVSP